MNVFYLKTWEHYSVFEYLFSYLEQNGVTFNEVEIDDDISSITNTEDTYLLMSTTAISGGLGKALGTILKIRHAFRRVDLKIVLGGALLTVLDIDDLRRNFPEIAYICQGPGEDFLKALFTQNLKPGVYNGYDFGEVNNYYLTDKQYSKLNSKHLVNVTFSGNTCKWGRCLFCHHTRSQSCTEHDEVQLFEIVNRYATERNHYAFYFYDNYIDIKKLEILLEILSDREYKNKLEFRFFGVKASDDFTELDDVLEKYDRNPIREVSIGVEFYHQELLNMYRKGTTVAQIDRALNWFLDNGVSTHAYMLIGMPGSKKEHRDRYGEFTEKYPEISQRVSFFRLSPGIRVYEMLDEFKIELLGENYGIHDLSGINDMNDVPLPNVATNYLKFKHWDDEEKKWISRNEDFERHKGLINFFDDTVLKEKKKFVYRPGNQVAR